MSELHLPREFSFSCLFVAPNLYQQSTSTITRSWVFRRRKWKMLLVFLWRAQWEWLGRDRGQGVAMLRCARGAGTSACDFARSVQFATLIVPLLHWHAVPDAV